MAKADGASTNAATPSGPRHPVFAGVFVETWGHIDEIRARSCIPIASWCIPSTTEFPKSGPDHADNAPGAARHVKATIRRRRQFSAAEIDEIAKLAKSRRFGETCALARRLGRSPISIYMKLGQLRSRPPTHAERMRAILATPRIPANQDDYDPRCWLGSAMPNVR